MLRTAKKGFTLIELLIVVVIIGILAAIAIPKFAATKQKAYVASMKTDLRNLVTIQEAYFSDHTTYGSFANISSTGSFHPSAGNTFTILGNDASGWAASATNSYVPSTTTPWHCAVWIGDQETAAVGVAAGDTLEGAPACN
jgi:type IV pilus assembly protein PilA